MKNCISRFCLLALLLLMTIAPVRAEIIGQTTENEYIHRLIADNGQELCFVSGEKDPYLSYADVNFDGINDVVILTQRGASNFVYQFFIFDGEQYVLCPLTFTNYDLDAEHKIVRSSVNGGLAGGIHRETLYRFDGTEAVLLRRCWDLLVLDRPGAGRLARRRRTGRSTRMVIPSGTTMMC